MDINKIEVIENSVNAISAGNMLEANRVINTEYPFEPFTAEKRKYSVNQMMEQFFKDGFIDRYTGEKLVNPGILRLMSEKMP